MDAQQQIVQLLLLKEITLCSFHCSIALDELYWVHRSRV